MTKKREGERHARRRLRTLFRLNLEIKETSLPSYLQIRHRYIYYIIVCNSSNCFRLTDYAGFCLSSESSSLQGTKSSSRAAFFQTDSPIHGDTLIHRRCRCVNPSAHAPSASAIIIWRGSRVSISRLAAGSVSKRRLKEPGRCRY